MSQSEEIQLLKRRVKHLEDEVKRLSYYSPYPEDSPEYKTTEHPNANSAFFNRYGG